jgi:hypothetical protein
VGVLPTPPPEVDAQIESAFVMDAGASPTAETVAFSRKEV